MKVNDKTDIRESAYLFNVDLLVEGESNALAMERLLHALNRCGFADFRIISGIELGKLITELETKTAHRTDSRIAPPSGDTRTKDRRSEQPKKEPVKKAESSPDSLLAAGGIKTLIDENRLIRLTVNKGFGVKLNIPCRIIQYDENSLILTVYHVDEKQVYTFKLNEIDDITV